MERRRGWLRMVIGGALLVSGGCASAPDGTAEIAPIWLRSAQTGVRERCGMELIREVQRANDLTWSERIFYTWIAQGEARDGVRDEEEWRRSCVERYKQQGYEVVSSSPAR